MKILFHFIFQSYVYIFFVFLIFNANYVVMVISIKVGLMMVIFKGV